MLCLNLGTLGFSKLVLDESLGTMRFGKMTLVSLPTNRAAVNAVRRGDWADATIGIVRSGLPAAYLEQAYTQVPESGFHLMLAGMTGCLSPNSIVGQFQVLKILKWS